MVFATKIKKTVSVLSLFEGCCLEVKDFYILLIWNKVPALQVAFT